MKTTLPRIILFFLFFLSHNFIYAQEDKLRIQKMGDQSLRQGSNFFVINEIDSALVYFKKAANLYEEANSWTRYVSALNDLTYIYNREKNLSEHTKFAFKAHDESNKYKAILDKEGKQVRIRAAEQLSTYYYSLGDYNKAIDISEEALILKKKNNISELEIANTYFNLGNFYKFLGDREQALSYFEETLKIQLDSLPGKSIIAKTYQDMGRVYRLNNSIDSTIHYLEKAESIFSLISNNSSSFNKKINNFLLLAELWNEKGNLQKANSYIDKVNKMSINAYYQVQLQETLGKILISQKQYQKAINSFIEGQRIADLNSKRNTPPLRAKRLIELAGAYHLSGDTINALATLQKALVGLAPGFENSDYLKNPKADQLLDRRDALIILQKKADLLQSLYKTNNKQNYLDAAQATYLVATELINDIRQGIINIESKNSLSGKTIPIYEGAIETTLELYSLTKEEQYKEVALHFAESNKASLLLESINEQQAKGFAGIPDSLLEKEKELKLKLAFLQEEKLKSQNNTKYDNDIFETNQALELLTRKFETEFPRYFELKYQNEPIALNTIQNELLNNESALFEYFVGEEKIYLFVVTNQNIETYAIPKEESIADKIYQLRNELSTAPTKSALQAFEDFTSIAYDLYNSILKTGINQLPQNIKQLIIVPDDYLNLIPFSILLSEAADPSKPGYSIDDLDYLLEGYSISYQYSTTLSYKRKQPIVKSFIGPFIGFAPSFKSGPIAENRACTADQLYSLQCNEDEVNQINALFSGNGEIYLNKDALKATFKEEAANYQILHLATHACINEQNSELNRIFLKDDYLSNFDLYNMELNTELAVLSACNTGSGELVRGEGVMNLARGFINAGCSSTVMSMWSVDDCATSDIMVAFYKNLHQGFNKDEALNRARIEYLHTASKTKMHPYYWSAFVAFGDMDKIRLSTSKNSFIYLIIIPIMLLFLILYKRKN